MTYKERFKKIMENATSMEEAIEFVKKEEQKDLEQVDQVFEKLKTMPVAVQQQKMFEIIRQLYQDSIIHDYEIQMLLKYINLCSDRLSKLFEPENSNHE